VGGDYSLSHMDPCADPRVAPDAPRLLSCRRWLVPSISYWWDMPLWCVPGLLPLLDCLRLPLILPRQRRCLAPALPIVAWPGYVS